MSYPLTFWGPAALQGSPLMSLKVRGGTRRANCSPKLLFQLWRRRGAKLAIGRVRPVNRTL